MNSTKNDTENSFPGIESKINWLATYVLQKAFFGILFIFFCLFVLGPAYGIYKRGLEIMLVPALLCWGISLLILIPATRYYVIKRKNLSKKIVVDHTGILFYNSKNEVKEQILYTELRASKQNFDIHTVTPVGSGIVPLLEITVQQEKKHDETTRIDMNLPLHVVKNKANLLAHFMHGIAVFRPDLKIDPMAFRAFSIDQNTWEINKRKGISSGGWLFIATVIVVTCVIFGVSFLIVEK